MLLYIHIPFCDSKCFYCAFNSYTDKFHLKKMYMNALTIQLENEVEKHIKNENRLIKTVFIGGGTPSCINHNEYEQVFKVLRPFLDKNAEITTEANPNSASIEWLKGMYDFGVNRVSFGVQSFNNDKLKFLGRSHTSSRAIKAIKDASCIGFKDINCDIIYGVKNDSFDSIINDFKIIFDLPINHISAYSLTIEEGTKFFNTSNTKIDDEELSKNIFNYLEKNGFNQYEISNFSLNENAQSKHNKGYWNHDEYLGIGAGAVGYKNKTRYYPNKNIEEYILNPLYSQKEILNSEDIKVEKVLLGLRSVIGIDLNILLENELKRVDELVKEKKMIIRNKRAYGIDFLLADALALYILD